MKILHIGLCVQPKPYNGFQQAFIDIVGEDNYREVSTGSKFLNAEVETILNDFTPNIVFMQVQAPNIIPISLCQLLKNKGAFIINWTGDKRHDVPQWMIDLAPYISLTSFSNMDDVNAMRSLGFKSEYLEIGYDPEIYKPEGEALNMPEIVFMGNNYGRGYFPMSGFRIDMVDFLRQEYGNRFGVYGSGWAYGNGNFNHSQLEEAKAYRGAKIAINCSHFDSLNYSGLLSRSIKTWGGYAYIVNRKAIPKLIAEISKELTQVDTHYTWIMKDMNWFKTKEMLVYHLPGYSDINEAHRDIKELYNKK